MFVLGAAVVSCETDEKFSGSPVDNQNIVTLKGSITTDVTAALGGQKIKFIAHLPEGKVFSDTVRVEVSAVNKSFGRIREYVFFKGGETSKEGEIESPGGAIFDTSFELSLTGIEVYRPDQGTHYLMTSDPVEILTGSSTVPTTSSDRLIVRLVWPDATTANNVRFSIDRPDPLADVNVTQLSSGGKNHNILKVTGNNTTTNSSAEGDYIFSITGLSQTTPIDLSYKVILRYPNGESEVFAGVYEAMTNASPLKPILKITKTGSGDDVIYTPEQL